MGAKLTGHIEDYFSRDYWDIFDDFPWYVITHLWTDLQADSSGTVAHEGPGRGRIKLVSSVDNEEAALSTVNELFKFVANKPMVCEAFIQQTKPNTDDGSMAFGWADAIGANQISDDGVALAINDSGAMIYTLKNESVWRFGSNIAGGTVETSTSDKTTVSAGGQQLRIEATVRSSTEFELRPFVDGVLLKTSDNVPIMHVITLGTSTDMDLGLYQKGHHANDYDVYADYIYGAMSR